MKTDHKHQNNEAVADLYRYAAERLREIAVEIFPKHAKITDKQEAGTDDR